MACGHGDNAGKIESLDLFHADFLSRARLSAQGHQRFIDVKIGTSYTNQQLRGCSGALLRQRRLRFKVYCI
jgi:hypothetical protein